MESDTTFLHEKFNYTITDPDQFDDGTPSKFTFAEQRPDLEQSAFVEDLIRLGDWTVSAGLRWDHYQLLVERECVQSAAVGGTLSAQGEHGAACRL